MSFWKKLFRAEELPKTDGAAEQSPKSLQSIPDGVTESHCPKCGKQLRFRLTGKQAKIRCPVCKNEFTYPVPEIDHCPFQGCGWPATRGIYCDRHASKEVRDQLNADHEKLVVEGEEKAKARAEASQHISSEAEIEKMFGNKESPKFTPEVTKGLDSLEKYIRGKTDQWKREDEQSEKRQMELLFRNSAMEGEADKVKMMIGFGVDVNARHEDGSTALLLAALKGRADCINVLIDAGADLNAKDSDGRTALIWAAKRGHANCVKALIAAGADLKAKENNGGTAFTSAASDEIATLLRPSTDVPTQRSLEPTNGLIRYRGLTFGIDGEYSLVCDDKKIVRGIWYRHREDIKNALRNRMVVATAGVNGFTVLDSDYETTIVGGIGGVEDLNNPGGSILWFDSTRALFGK